MTGQKRKHYPENWEAMALYCKEAANWQCQHCGVEQFTMKISRAGKPYIVYLAACHVNHDKGNPNPELLALCISCHARYDYQYKQREKRIALERMRHQRELARRVDLRFYGG